MTSLCRGLALGKNGVISLVGAGGKTSLMFRLAHELSASGDTVLTTTTTKIYPPAGQSKCLIVPDCTNWIIGIVGLSALGKPLDEHTVLRPELVSKITGLAEGKKIMEKTICDLLLHRQGLFQGTPMGAKKIAYLNQADIPSKYKTVRLTHRPEQGRRANPNIKCSNTPSACPFLVPPKPCFDHLYFGHSVLFKISTFVLRI
jgi:hypothetical protein